MACDSSFRWWLRLGSTTDTGCDTMCVLRALNRSTGKVLTEKQDHEQQILKTLPPSPPSCLGGGGGGWIQYAVVGWHQCHRRALKSGDRETRSFSVNRRFMLSLIINTLPHCIDIMNHSPPPPLNMCLHLGRKGGSYLSGVTRATESRKLTVWAMTFGKSVTIERTYLGKNTNQDIMHPNFAWSVLSGN